MVDSSSSSASSTSSTPTSSLTHPLPARPLPSPTPAPFTPVQPTINLMTPTPPPSTTRPHPESPTDNSKMVREWRASPLTSQLTNLDTSDQTPPVQLPTPAANSVKAASPPFNNATPNPLQTTNVYINGLPPQYKDEELYALASQFGTVLSCRTFTRQLSDTPSGYGFVLFETIEAAQECINVLRSHHNLHPHFAKQAHKIPGVPSYKPEDPIAEHAGDIYIEGLPMHVDAPTLRALLTPHTVLSSRFFADTRVQPPLLVAFVRLATRTAAQDVYRRLHGRTVRGYSARLAVSLGDSESNEVNLIDGDVEMSNVSGMPAPPPDAYDPFADMDFSFAPRAQNQKQTYALNQLPTHSNAKNPAQHYSPQQIQHPLFQNQAQLPVDDLLSTLQGLNLHAPHIPPLQPLNATLQEIQMRLENLRPLLAAYGTPNVSQNHMQSFTSQNNHQNLAPQNRNLGVQRLRSHSHSHEQQQQQSLSGPAIGGHSRAHTTGHAYSGLGLGAPLFSQQQPAQRHTSNPEKAPGSERAWTTRG